MDKLICPIIIIFLTTFRVVIEARSYAPCRYIKLKLSNNILEFQESRQGLYKLHEIVNGKYSWKSTTNLSLFRDAQAIWYIPQSNSWSIGKFSDIGTETVGIYTSGNQADSNHIEYLQNYFSLQACSDVHPSVSNILTLFI